MRNVSRDRDAGTLSGSRERSFFRAFLWNEGPFTGYGALEEAFFLRGKSFSGFFLVPWDYAAIKGAVSDKRRHRELFSFSSVRCCL